MNYISAKLLPKRKTGSNKMPARKAPDARLGVPYLTGAKVAGGGDRSSAFLSAGSREALPTARFFQA